MPNISRQRQTHRALQQQSKKERKKERKKLSSYRGFNLNGNTTRHGLSLKIRFLFRSSCRAPEMCGARSPCHSGSIKVPRRKYIAYTSSIATGHSKYAGALVDSISSPQEDEKIDGARGRTQWHEPRNGQYVHKNRSFRYHSKWFSSPAGDYSNRESREWLRTLRGRLNVFKEQKTAAMYIISDLIAPLDRIERDFRSREINLWNFYVFESKNGDCDKYLPRRATLVCALHTNAANTHSRPQLSSAALVIQMPKARWVIHSDQFPLEYSIYIRQSHCVRLFRSLFSSLGAVDVYRACFLVKWQWINHSWTM